MSYFSALDVSASGLSVQRARMDLISQMEVAVTHIEDDELRGRTQFIINKLTFMKDDEFDAEDFTSNIGSDE